MAIGRIDAAVSLYSRIGISLKSLKPGKFSFQGYKDVNFKGGFMAETEITNLQAERYFELRQDKAREILAYHPIEKYRDPAALLAASKAVAKYTHEANDCPFVLATGVQFLGIAEDIGLRLPNELEWERAAAGEEGRIYSFGDTFDGTRAAFNCGGTRSVYAHRQFATPEGILDLSGNVWEWTGNPRGKIDFSDPQNPVLPSTGNSMILRGGSWDDSNSDNLRSDCRNSYRANGWGNDLGARFAMDLH